MGNVWKGISNEKMYQAEADVWKAGGIDSSCVTAKNVHLGGDDPEYFIRQIDIAPTTPGLPRIVMIHGYGGGGPIFVKMVALMREHFWVTTIDLLGLAASGRPDFQAREYDQASAWFLHSMYEWVKRAGLDHEPFHLLGHSFGGFIAGQYAYKYPEQIKSLILLSPVGVERRPKDREL